MELCTLVLYSQLAGFYLPPKKSSVEAPLPLAFVSLDMSSPPNNFVQRVEHETITTSSTAEYSIPEDNIAHASAIGIAFGMLKALKIKAGDYGQTRLYGLAYKLVRPRSIWRRAKRLRLGDHFRLNVEGNGKIYLEMNQSTPQSRAQALAKIMSLRPKKRMSYGFDITKASPYIQSVAKQAEVIEPAQRVEYVVAEDDIAGASAIGTALGMLHTLQIKAGDFGQSKLQGLALKLVLRKAIRRKARSFHKGDRFAIQLTKKGRLVLNIEDNAVPLGDVFQNENIAGKSKLPSKRLADEMMASFAPIEEPNVPDDGEVDDDFDAAFKPENIIRNNINAIVSETMVALNIPAKKNKVLRADLQAFLKHWSEVAAKVDDRFVSDFVTVIVKDLVAINPKAKTEQVRKSVLSGLKKEHSVYDTREEALRETAKEILVTMKEMKKKAD